MMRAAGGGDDESRAEATEVGGDDSGEPGKGGASECGEGEEWAEAGVLAGAREKKRDDEWV